MSSRPGKNSSRRKRTGRIVPRRARYGGAASGVSGRRSMNIVVFEDGLHDSFYPLSLTKPLWEMRSGLFSFRERLDLFVRGDDRLSTGGIFYFTRDHLVPFYRERYPLARINDTSPFDQGGEIFFINALLYPETRFFEIERNSAIFHGDVPVVARLDAGSIPRTFSSISDMLKSLDISRAGEGSPDEGDKASTIWDLVVRNADTIVRDWALAGVRGNGNTLKDVTIHGEGNQVYRGDGAVLEPFVFIDATGGPVLIGPGARIDAFSRIEGPCAIGAGCRILGGKIRAGVSIGERCRVGGEVEQSILHGFVNKYHDGFIGHSYIGEWVNLGALTTNSDLKNDYSKIKVYTPHARRRTGERKMGCFMGDFVKTSIGTLINTGSSIGPGAMLVHAGSLTPFHIPPFSWYINGTVVRPGPLDDYLSTCREAMSRRGVETTPAFADMLSGVYEMTAGKGEKP